MRRRRGHLVSPGQALELKPGLWTLQLRVWILKWCFVPSKWMFGPEKEALDPKIQASSPNMRIWEFESRGVPVK